MTKEKNMPHIAVLRREVIEYLSPQSGENFIDGTLGAGGHAVAILEKTAPDGHLLGFDWDEEALEWTKAKFQKNQDLAGRIIFINDNYSSLKKYVKGSGFGPVAGILVDLGLSSDQLENSGRGFSFQKNEPLDMRYSRNNVLTAREIVNNWPAEEIKKILWEYGEEPWAGRISAAIGNFRRKRIIATVGELLGVIATAVPKKFQRGRTHFATRTFQSLRVAVNDELGNLRKFLPEALDTLAVGGRLGVISFQSLEDRIVKNFFRENARARQGKILTKKPITAGEAELAVNPRSRSAKLRVFKKIEKA